MSKFTLASGGKQVRSGGGLVAAAMAGDCGRKRRRRRGWWRRRLGNRVGGVGTGSERLCFLATASLYGFLLVPHYSLTAYY